MRVAASLNYDLWPLLLSCFVFCFCFFFSLMNRVQEIAISCHWQSRCGQGGNSFFNLMTPSQTLGELLSLDCRVYQFFSISTPAPLLYLALAFHPLTWKCIETARVVVFFHPPSALDSRNTKDSPLMFNVRTWQNSQNDAALRLESPLWFFSPQ